MIIHSKKYLPEPSGVWLFDHDTGELEYLDTHKGSSVYTEWPVMDRHKTLHIAHGVDSLLNAAASGKKDKLDRALRARWAGDKLGLLVDTPMQSDFWYRHVAAFGSLGAQRRMFLGDTTEGSQLGFVIDDSNDNTTVDGWAGGTGSSTGNNPGDDGNGPGRGRGGKGASTLAGRSAGGGGGYALEGNDGDGSNTTGGAGGISIPPEWSYAALFMNSYTVSNLAVGGSGGGGGAGGGDGGDAGDAYIRFSVENITETVSKTLTGSIGGTSFYGGGGGSGGLYFSVCTGNYTLNNGVTIDCEGGPLSDTNFDGGAGSNGRVILLFGNSATITGTISNAVTSKKQMLLGLPRGGSLYY